MSPTWLEIAVAILLLWVAWRLALILTPWVISRFRERRLPPPSVPRKADRSNDAPALTNKKE